MYGKVRHLLSAEDNNMPVPTGIVLRGLGPIMHSVKLHPAPGSERNEFRETRNEGALGKICDFQVLVKLKKYAWDVLPTCQLNVFIPAWISILSSQHTRPNPHDLWSLWASVGVATCNEVSRLGARCNWMCSCYTVENEPKVQSSDKKYIPLQSYWLRPPVQQN